MRLGESLWRHTAGKMMCFYSSAQVRKHVYIEVYAHAGSWVSPPPSPTHRLAVRLPVESRKCRAYARQKSSIFRSQESARSTSSSSPSMPSLANLRALCRKTLSSSSVSQRA